MSAPKTPTTVEHLLLVATAVEERLDKIERDLTALKKSERAETIARLLEADMHQFSTRPCQTCRSVTALLGRPFGCVVRQKEKTP